VASCAVRFRITASIWTKAVRVRHDARTQKFPNQELCDCQIVKELDYLIDNHCATIISIVKESDQEESGQAAERVPKLGNEKCDELGAGLRQNDPRLPPFSVWRNPGYRPQNGRCENGHPENGRVTYGTGTVVAAKTHPSKRRLGGAP
jgi:hypothetical protein